MQKSFLSLSILFFFALINLMSFCIFFILAIVFREWFYGLVAGLNLLAFLIVFCYGLIYTPYKELGNPKK